MVVAGGMHGGWDVDELVDVIDEILDLEGIDRDTAVVADGVHGGGEVHETADVIDGIFNLEESEGIDVVI